MHYSILIAPVFLLAIPATASAADCKPVFVKSDQAVMIDGVEIESGGRAVRDFQVQIRNAAEPSSASGPVRPVPCATTIRIARVGAARDPDFPPYLISAPGNGRIEILPDVASGGTAHSDVVIANAPSGPQGRPVPFRIGVPTEWGLRAGTYVEQLQISAIDQSGGVADRSTLTITIIIPSAASVRLVGAVVGGGGRGPAQVNLGNLSSSKETRSQPFGALIFSTAPYTVRFSSTNRGYLLHEQGREQVPYRLFFDGAAVDLAGANEFAYPGHTPKRGDRRSMSIVVPAVTALAGRYSDRITATVTAL